jgi:hypothetical protein
MRPARGTDHRNTLHGANRRCKQTFRVGVAPRYEHVGFGDQFEPERLLPQALEEFHMPRRKTQRN